MTNQIYFKHFHILRQLSFFEVASSIPFKVREFQKGNLTSESNTVHSVNNPRHYLFSEIVLRKKKIKRFSNIQIKKNIYLKG